MAILLNLVKSCIVEREPWWAMRRSGVEEWLVQAVMALYSGVRTMLGHEEVRCGGMAGTSGDDIV